MLGLWISLIPSVIIELEHDIDYVDKYLIELFIPSLFHSRKVQLIEFIHAASNWLRMDRGIYFIFLREIIDELFIVGWLDLFSLSAITSENRNRVIIDELWLLFINIISRPLTSLCIALFNLHDHHYGIIERLLVQLNEFILSVDIY